MGYQHEGSSDDNARVLVESFAVNERMNQVLLEYLHPDAWQAKPPGKGTRTIAAIFTHMHNIRRKWLRLSTPHILLPEELNRSHCTQAEARTALAKSAVSCGEMLADMLTGSPPRMASFHRDGWAKPWPAGPSMLVYMISHEAHHRGQASMLAHQLGYRLPAKAQSRLWSWETLWKECGFSHPR